uniref:DUF1638 domain-containing protein n=1 Tax=Gracilinema caldarium TaxID=215591 RepID=A0A7C3E4N2_9SPIR
MPHLEQTYLLILNLILWQPYEMSSYPLQEFLKMHDEEPLTLIACGIFKKEFKSLPKELKNKFHPRFLNSMLHMNPDLLDKAISYIINKHPDKKLMLLYGDCSAHMHELVSGYGRTRTEGLNCIEIFLGKDLYHTLRKQGTFFLMPEWALRWKEIFL